MPEKLGKLAELLGAELVGDPEIEITGVATLTLAGKHDLSFFHNPKYHHELEKTHAGAVIVPSDHPPLPPQSAALITKDPYLAMARAVTLLVPSQKHPPGVSSLAYVAPNAKVSPQAHLAPFTCVMEEAEIGPDSVLLPFAYIGRKTMVGADCLLYPHCAILDDCIIGDRAIIHAGAVIGSDGFGFAPSPQGCVKFPQVGKVIIGNDVELGANVTIDRGALGDTIVGNGVKLDNLVHLAHNVKVGDNTLIAAQTGIAGSTEIGEWCLFGGQVGLVGHLTIGKHVMFGAQSGVTKNCHENTVIFGTPAHDLHEEKRRQAHIGRLEELFKRVKELERKIEELSKDKS